MAPPARPLVLAATAVVAVILGASLLGGAGGGGLARRLSESAPPLRAEPGPEPKTEGGPGPGAAEAPRPKAEGAGVGIGPPLRAEDAPRPKAEAGDSVDIGPPLEPLDEVEAAAQPKAQAVPEATAIAAAAAAPSLRGANSTPAIASGGGCLCVFDIDRTLTGRQGLGPPGCPSNEVQRGVYDDAYGGGELTLSPLARSGLGGTACGGCRIGIVSHGTAGGRAMKDKIRSVIGGADDHWSTPHHIHSPLVIGCGYKPPCVQGVLDWFNRRGAGIPPWNVHLFDDKRSNVEAFRGSAMNAHQISCAGGDGDIGRCGAEPHEIRLSPGVSVC